MMIAMECKEKEPQMNADERRFVTSAHRKDRKAQRHLLNFCMVKHPKNGMRIARFFADNRIRVHPRHPCSITFALEGKRS